MFLKEFLFLLFSSIFELIASSSKEVFFYSQELCNTKHAVTKVGTKDKLKSFFFVRTFYLALSLPNAHSMGLRVDRSVVLKITSALFLQDSYSFMHVGVNG